MKLADLQFIRSGSAKDIYRVDKLDIAFRFTDHISVFDVGRSRWTIPGKARAMCASAVKSFQIAKEIGIPTHFVEQLDPVTIRVKEAQVIADRLLTTQDENYLVPAEFIYRLLVAGSIDRDFRSGEKKPENYGLPAGVIPTVGTPFPYPLSHLTTKLEHVDRDLTEEEVCRLAGITMEDLSHYWAMINRLIGACSLEMARCGYTLLDGKVEPLMGPGRRKMIGDVFCTPDEDRPVLTEKLDQGIVEHHSKEFLRQKLINMGYQDWLKAARDKGEKEPPIPKLPGKTIEEASRRYKAVAEAYAGVKLDI